MNMPRSVGLGLVERGHGADHAGDLGLSGAEDELILEAARTLDAILITHDLDFGRLLAFSGGTRPSVLILRGIDNKPDEILSVLDQQWSWWGPAADQGAVVILEPSALRIRSLPIEL